MQKKKTGTLVRKTGFYFGSAVFCLFGAFNVVAGRVIPHAADVLFLCALGLFLLSLATFVSAVISSCKECGSA